MATNNATSPMITSKEMAEYEDFEEPDETWWSTRGTSSDTRELTQLWIRVSAIIKSSPDFPAHLVDKMRKMIDLQYDSTNGVNVFVDDFKKCVLNMAIDFSGRYRDARSHMYSTLEQVIDRGPYRKHVLAYDVEGLNNMHKRFPNFTEVVSFYNGALALHSKLNTSVTMDPVLLIGEPGTGKTFFSQDLSRVLRSEMFVENMDAPDISYSIIGSDKHWANSSYGKIFSSLVLGEHINPVIILDEIDKAYKFSRNGADIFHSILEERTATIFKDKCIDYPIDASWITWIATANEEQDLPRSILNRFQVFHIKPLTEEQKRSIVQDKVLSIGNGVFSMDDEAVEIMSKMDMRTIQRSIKSAMGRTAMRGSTVICASDASVQEAPKQAKIGFI